MGGAVWCLLGTMPIVPVAAIWSSYFYLFAMCGAAFALGAVLARAPLALALIVVAALGAGSLHARRLSTFAATTTPWSPVSHVNGWYLQRGMHYIDAYSRQMRELHPLLPPGSTVYWSGVAPWIG